MAQIDKFLATMAQRGVDHAVLYNNRPSQVFKGTQEAVGPTLTIEQLQAILREIIPVTRRSEFVAGCQMQFSYFSSHGFYEMELQWDGTTLQLSITPSAGFGDNAANLPASASNIQNAGPNREVQQPPQQMMTPTLLTSFSVGSRVGALAFSPDNRMLVSGSANSQANLWDLERGSLRHSFSHGGITDLRGITSISFAPSGRTLACGSQGKLSVWGLLAEKARWTKSGLNKYLSVACSPDGQRVASVDFYGAVSFWNLEDGKFLDSSDKGFMRGSGALFANPSMHFIAFSRDGRTLASGGWRYVKVHDGVTAAVQRTHHDGSADALALMVALAYSPDGKIVATGSQSTGNCKVLLWDSTTGLQHPLKSHTAAGNAVAFSPDSRTLATGSADGTVKLWEVATGELQRTIQGKSGAINAVAFSPDGKMLAYGDDQKAHLYRIA